MTSWITRAAVVFLFYGCSFSFAQIPAEIDAHTIMYKKEGVYAVFPDVYTLPDDRLGVGFAKRAVVSHVVRGVYETRVSGDGSYTWEDLDMPLVAKHWVKPGGQLITADSEGWIETPASWRSILEAQHKYIVDVDDDTIAYLGGFFYKVSNDGGESWTEFPISKPSDVIGTLFFMKGSSDMSTSSGVHLVSIYGHRYRETAEYPDGLVSWEVFFLRSADDGATWQFIEQIPGGMDPNVHPSGGLNETAIVENDAGEIIALSRSYADAHKMFVSVSTDDGLTWSNPVDTGIDGLPPSLTRLSDGRIMCSYGRRHPVYGIFARISEDGGHSWPGASSEIVIRDDFPAKNDNGYPTSRQLDDGSFFTVYYTSDAEDITHIAASYWSTQVYPEPYNNEEDVPVDANLDWLADSGALSYDVYFGTDPTPDGGEFAGNQTGALYDPGVLSSNTIYYWRIDKVTAGGTVTGSVWSFETEDGFRDLRVSSLYGAPSPSVGTHSYALGTSVQCTVPVTTATLGTTQMVVNGWDGFGCAPMGGATNDTGSFALMNDAIVVWNWDTEYRLEATNATAGGTVSPESGWYPDSDLVTVTASPEGWHQFVSWSGDVPAGQEGDNPLQLVMDRPHTISALFEPVEFNPIPYSEPFETYALGFQLPGINGWVAWSPDAAVVSTNAAMISALTNSYSGGFPVATNHTQVLQIAAPVTNAVDSGSIEQVKVDCIVAFTDLAPPESALVLPPALPVSEQTAFYVDADGYVNMMHARTADGANFTNEWLALEDGPVLGSNEWVRVTVLLDYDMHMFQLQLNGGVPVSNAVGWTEGGGSQPGSWFHMADRTSSGLGKIHTREEVWLDDLRVDPENAYLLTLSCGFGGGVSPGNGWYNADEKPVLTGIPDSWYHFGTWSGSGTNAITTGTATDAVVTVTMAGPVVLHAGFEADATSGGTPHWWLVQENPVWSNDFEAAAVNDFDSDGMATSNEYVAGTGSTDSNSVFKVDIDGETVSFQTLETTPQYGNLKRYYSLQGCTNLPLEIWMDVPGYTNILGAGQVTIYTNNPPLNTSGFFRGRVRVE